MRGLLDRSFSLSGETRDEERRRLANTIYALVGLLMGGSVILVITLFLRQEFIPVQWVLMGNALLLLCLPLTRMGYLEVPRFLIPIITLAVTTLVILNGQGIHDIAILAYAVSIALSGLLLGAYGPIIFAVLSFFCIAGVYYAEAEDLIHTPFTAATSGDDLIIIAILFGFTALLMNLAMRHLATSLQRTRQSEAALRNLNEQLEQKVFERTASLQAANERLQALSQIKDQFVSNVSHELRSPITNIKLYLELLSQVPEKRGEFLETLTRETNRLEYLIERLLMLSRLDQERIELQFEQININQLASHLSMDRKALADEKNLTLVFEPEPDLPLVEADPQLLEQVFSILLTNALNYTPGGGQVAVRTASFREDHKQWVRFSVSDSGPGIQLDEIGQLFTRFYRGTAARQSGEPGTGLGLAIASEIVRRHHGRMEVQQEGLMGTGATFSAWIPALHG